MLGAPLPLIFESDSTFVEVIFFMYVNVKGSFKLRYLTSFPFSFPSFLNPYISPLPDLLKLLFPEYLCLLFPYLFLPSLLCHSLWTPTSSLAHSSLVVSQLYFLPTLGALSSLTQLLPGAVSQ